LERIFTAFEISTFKAKNGLYFPPRPCLMPPAPGTRLNFYMKLTPQKLEEWSYHVVKNSKS